MKIPVVREWGSWVVFISSCAAAFAVGLSTRPWDAGREFSALAVSTVLGLTFLINAKNPLASTIRTKGRDMAHVSWLVFFLLTGIVMLMPFLMKGMRYFSVFIVPVVSYVILLYRGKEHHLFTELNGFALLTASAPVAYFSVTGDVSFKLYAAVLLFFCAGVFKVRVRTRKTLMYRIIMVLYCGVSAIVYYLLDISILILAPFVENIISAVMMREERLRTTGNIELVKGVIFIILTGILWNRNY